MHNVMEVDNMDEPVKKKYNIAFMALLLIVLSVFYIWLSVVYFSDYINKKYYQGSYWSIFYTFCTIVTVLCIRQYHDFFE